MFDSTVIKKQNVRQSISETYKGGIVQSSITQFNAASRPTACSVKIVLKGEEHYKVDQHWYSLKENKILLVPAGSNVETNIDSKNVVEGICFYLDFALFSSKDDLLNEESPIIDADWRSDYFKEPINISGTPLLESIQELNQGNPSEDVDYSLYRFYRQFDQFSQVYANRVQHIKAQKQSTLSELARRIEMGRQFIHDHFGKKFFWMILPKLRFFPLSIFKEPLHPCTRRVQTTT